MQPVNTAPRARNPGKRRFNSLQRFMTKLTALIHARNDALRLGRCLETMYPCDDIIVVDHGSTDGTVKVALAYGARIIGYEPSKDPARDRGTGGWILCLDPREALTEGLAASLFEWKLGALDFESPALAVA